MNRINLKKKKKSNFILNGTLESCVHSVNYYTSVDFLAPFDKLLIPVKCLLIFEFYVNAILLYLHLPLLFTLFSKKKLTPSDKIRI